MSYNKKNEISNKVRRGKIYGRFANVLFAKVLATLSNENVEVADVKKWQPEVDIFSFSVLRLDKFVQRESKQRHSDSLCETKVFHQARHRTSGCY